MSVRKRRNRTLICEKNKEKNKIEEKETNTGKQNIFSFEISEKIYSGFRKFRKERLKERVEIMLRVFLTNLGKYNEGELVGEWIDLPCTESELEEVKKRIGINEEYEEWFIADHETDVEGLGIDEYDDLNELNELAEEIEDLSEEERKVLQAYLLDCCDFEEALENVSKGNYTIYSDCDSMTDVAYEVIEQCGYLNNVPDAIARYVDYEAFGRDLDIEGNYYEIDGDIIEIF